MSKNINHYKVRIVTKTGIIDKKLMNEFFMDEVSVLDENEIKYVLKDLYFTYVNKKRSTYLTTIDVPSISSRANDRCFGSGINYDLYTFKTKRAKIIKKEIEDYVELKYGGFSSIDLNFIKE